MTGSNGPVVYLVGTAAPPVRELAEAGVRLLAPDSRTSRGADGPATFDWNTAITEFLRAE